MTAQGCALRSAWLRAPPQSRRAIFPMCYGIQFTERRAMNRAAAYWRFSRPRINRWLVQIARRNDIEHRLTKPRHPWTNGQVERMNRTIKDATVKRYHYDSHDQLREHLAAFVDAYNYGRRLKTLRGLTPYEAICRAWAADPSRFRYTVPTHLTSGLNT